MINVPAWLLFLITVNEASQTTWYILLVLWLQLCYGEAAMGGGCKVMITLGFWLTDGINDGEENRIHKDFSIV